MKRGLVFFLIAIAVIVGVNFNSLPPTDHTVLIKKLGFSHVLYIFGINSISIFTMLLLSITGLHLVMIFKVFMLIAQGPQLSGIDPIIYYGSSFTHGIGELLLCYLVLRFSIAQFKLIYGYIRDKKDKHDFKDFYSNFFKKTLPIIVLILFISALCEVYISNPLIIMLTSS